MKQKLCLEGILSNEWSRDKTINTVSMKNTHTHNDTLKRTHNDQNWSHRDNAFCLTMTVHRINMNFLTFTSCLVITVIIIMLLLDLHPWLIVYDEMWPRCAVINIKLAVPVPSSQSVWRLLRSKIIRTDPVPNKRNTKGQRSVEQRNAASLTFDMKINLKLN